MKESLRLHFLRSTCSVFLLLNVLPAANASGIPTVDVTSIAQQIAAVQQLIEQTGIGNAQLNTQLQQLQEAFTRAQQLQQQIGQLQETINSLTGTRDLAGLLDGPAYDAVNGLLPTNTDGVDASATTERFVDLLLQDAPREAAQVRSFDPEGRFARTHTDATDRVYLSYSAADVFIERSNEIDALYGTMIQSIDGTPDAKASIDLLARITAENGRTMNRLTQMIALDASADAAINRRDIAILEDERTLDQTRLADVVEAITSGNQ